MPKTKKLSYEKRRERRKAARRLLRMNEDDSLRPPEMISADSRREIEIHDDNVPSDEQDEAHVASNDGIDNKCFSQRGQNDETGDAAEKRKLLKKEWWATHKEKINETRRADYATKQTIRFRKIGEQYVARTYRPETRKKDK